MLLFVEGGKPENLKKKCRSKPKSNPGDIGGRRAHKFLQIHIFLRSSRIYDSSYIHLRSPHCCKFKAFGLFVPNDGQFSEIL